MADEPSQVPLFAPPAPPGREAEPARRGTGPRMSIPEAEPPALKFEEALSRLEAVVARLEGGDLPLEDALSLFEEGVRLTRLCSARLEEAERKVSLLLRDEQGALREVPFGEAEEEDEEDQ